MRRLLLLIALLVAAVAAWAQSATFSSLEERMTAKEFRDAGLDQLSPEQLATLNAWIERNVRLADPAVAAAVASGQTAPAAPAPVDMTGFENRDRNEVVSRIVGPFKGWFGKTEFQLENGQVWQQVEDDRFPFNAESPGVTISPGAFGSWRLKVDGSNRTTLVKRIR